MFIAHGIYNCNIRVSKHDHIVNIQGLCEYEDSIFLLLEFCALGSIDDFLRKNSNSGYYNTEELIKWCFQVADGMEFLAMKNIIHVS
jgi:serine/threonine protein kinase